MFKVEVYEDGKISRLVEVFEGSDIRETFRAAEKWVFDRYAEENSTTLEDGWCVAPDYFLVSEFGEKRL